MAKRKTACGYAAAIAELHQQRLEYPDSKTIIRKIDTQVRGWMRRVEIVVQVAQNEQTPWTSEMIGYPTEPMPLKKDSGFAQTGDYVGVVRTSDGDRYVPASSAFIVISSVLFITFLDVMNNIRKFIGKRVGVRMLTKCVAVPNTI